MTSIIRKTALWSAITIFLLMFVPPLFGYTFMLNTTKSIPVGIYWGTAVKKGQPILENQIACFRYNSAPKWAESRNYFPKGFTLCKKVIGVEGAVITTSSSFIQVLKSTSRLPIAIALPAKFDSKFRPTQAYNLNGIIPKNKLLLIGTGSNRSMDSRYLGLIDQSNITYTAVPLITI